jgi:hypothetical protein
LGFRASDKSVCVPMSVIVFAPIRSSWAERRCCHRASNHRPRAYSEGESSSVHWQSGDE